MKILRQFIFSVAVGLTSALAFASAAAQTAINLANPIQGSGYTFANHVFCIRQNGNYTFTGSTSQNRITINPDVTATVIFDNVSITAVGASPFELLSNGSSGANVTLHLTGANSLTATTDATDATGTVYSAALQVTAASVLTIRGLGSLTATGSYGAAGIGSGFIEGDDPQTTGNIAIGGGIITAYGGYFGAAIGGAPYAQVGNITIGGGTLMAIAGDGAAAIGGGYQTGNPGAIRITGGNVYAISNYATAIGTGIYGPANAGSITITDGAIIASHIGARTGYTGGPTPTTVTGGTILTGNINATAFGKANVQIIANLSDSLVQAMGAIAIRIAVAKDTAIVDTLYTDTLIIYDSTWQAISVVDTLYDAIIIDTISRDSTIHRLTPRDSIIYHPSIVVLHTEIPLRDTTRDTVDVFDTLWIKVEDTVWRYIEVIDTLRTTFIVGDTTFVADTNVVHDTIVEIREEALPVYIIVDLITAEQTVVSDSMEAGVYGIGVQIKGLTPLRPFNVYSVGGILLVRDIATSGGSALLPTLTEGTYLLWHEGRWWKVVCK